MVRFNFNLVEAPNCLVLICEAVRLLSEIPHPAIVASLTFVKSGLLGSHGKQIGDTYANRSEFFQEKKCKAFKKNYLCFSTNQVST